MKTAEAIRILNEALGQEPELRNAFIASIESSLVEQGVVTLPFQDEAEMAIRIFKRLIGEE